MPLVDQKSGINSIWAASVTDTTKNKTEDEMRYILVTDVGSTTTKARLFGKKNGEWRYIVSGESPTTVEAPFENVCMGVINAVKEIEELLHIKILSHENKIITDRTGSEGVDFYCTTSSAGGGLQMMVAGVMVSLTAESANRAALGAGSIVMDIVAVDDGRKDHLKINRIRNLRPDMILLAGGTDGGTTELVMQIAELINAANPKPRLGTSYRLPLIYAGNKFLRNNIQELMKNNFEIEIVDNLRPVLEVENTEPARRAIHELFMEHVMSHAPGYTQLMEWTDLDIMPTPAGEGLGMQLIARAEHANVMGVGLGGATTNVYSIVEGRFVRSVSANLGMSYSICNVLKETGIENILRWIPFEIEKSKLENILRNKMIRPTTIPQTLKMLIIEHAVAREALRLGMKHHKTIATRLKGAKQAERMIGEIMESQLQETYINMMNIDIITGTGGLLSHAPKRAQTLQILMDAWQPEGITKFYQDSVFMMPHLGVLSTAYPDVAWNIFDKDCLIRLGTVIAPVGLGKEGSAVLHISVEGSDGTKIEKEIKYGDITQIPLPERVKAKTVINPTHEFDVGAGPGKAIEKVVEGGVVGIVIDSRGRPLTLPDETDRKKILRKWYGALDLYPLNSLDSGEGGL
jgi:uncharacterized protein (TIGR01319 family)